MSSGRPMARPMRDRRGAILVAAIAALALHGALLWGGGPTAAGGAAPGPDRARMAARWITVVRPPTPAGVESAEEPSLEEPAPLPTPASEPPPPQHETATQAAGLAPANDDEYVDAGRLAVRPLPVETISIPAPETEGRSGTYKATLVLFIDRDGTVARITVEDSSLPAELESVARAAFGAARFHPGMIGQRPVKTKLRVEVGFDGESATR